MLAFKMINAHWDIFELGLIDVTYYYITIIERGSTGELYNIFAVSRVRCLLTHLSTPSL